jgi:hypothetical protein
MLEWWKEGDERRERSIQSAYSTSSMPGVEYRSANETRKDDSLFKPVACCSQTLISISDYEVHHELQHHHRCETCHMAWANERILLLHMREQHDVFFRLRREKEGDTFHGYTCWLPHCGKQFNSEKSRRRHIIDAHSFPSDFPFYFMRNGRKIALTHNDRDRLSRT